VHAGFCNRSEKIRCYPESLTSPSRSPAALFAERTDQQGHYRAKTILDSFLPLIRELATINDDSHVRCGEIAYSVYESSKSILSRFAAATLDANTAFYMQQGVAILILTYPKAKGICCYTCIGVHAISTTEA
jgi:hypothetical protein